MDLAPRRPDASCPDISSARRRELETCSEQFDQRMKALQISPADSKNLSKKTGAKSREK